MNNKISTAINIVLAIAVVILFVLYFNLKNTFGANSDVLPEKQKVSVSDDSKSGTEMPKIAYFEVDSLENNYTYFKSIKKSLASRENNIQSQIRKMQNDFNEKVKDFRKKVLLCRKMNKSPIKNS